jgi:tryptophan-rich sensory protein
VQPSDVAVTGWRAGLGAIAWVVISFAAGWVGSRWRVDEWYWRLTRPSWTPPDWVFAPVWTALYLLMAAAAWLVWRRHGVSGAGLALGLFLLQLVHNALWPWLFFGEHRLGLAFLEIVVLWLLILATLLRFYRLVPLAGALLAPYLAWVAFAAALNGAFWSLNRPNP